MTLRRSLTILIVLFAHHLFSQELNITASNQGNNPSIGSDTKAWLSVKYFTNLHLHDLYSFSIILDEKSRSHMVWKNNTDFNRALLTQWKFYYDRLFTYKDRLNQLKSNNTILSDFQNNAPLVKYLDALDAFLLKVEDLHKVGNQVNLSDTLDKVKNSHNEYRKLTTLLNELDNHISNTIIKNHLNSQL